MNLAGSNPKLNVNNFKAASPGGFFHCDSDKTDIHQLCLAFCLCIAQDQRQQA
jgi:hypothetical protein